MPQELKRVNGRWVVTGAQKSSDLVPTPKPAGQRMRPMPARAAAPRPRPKPQAKPWWAKLGNDLLYEWRQSPVGAAWNQLNVGLAGASDNALRMGYSAVQRMQGRPKADPTSGRFGAGLDRFVDDTYRRLGAKPPSQMSQAERNVDQMRRSVALNLALAPATPGLGAAKATTAIGMGLRGGAAFALNEALSTFLDDNTSGNVVNLLNSLRLDPTDFKGVPLVRGLREGEKGLALPGGVNVGQDDMVDAALKSFAPNAAASLGLGLGAGAAVSGFRNIRRNVRAHRAVQREMQQRSKQEAMGFLQKDEADAYDFTPEAKAAAQQPAAPAAPEPTFQEANAAMEARLGMNQPEAAPAPEQAPIPTIENANTDNFGMAQAADLPEGDPAIDYWTYDPDLPESTALGKTLEELSDQELVTVVNNPGLPVVERVNQIIEARGAINAPPPLSEQMVMAPTDRLADDYLQGMTRTLGARQDYELRPLFDPDANPDLWRRAQSISGVDDPSQLTRADMIDTFKALEGEGRTVLTNRLTGSQMMPTPDIQAAPKVFQYKGGVNEAGEQLGNSLEGMERWDPNGEGIIQVWRDAAGEIGPAGQVYVVNGHNRLALANRLGIPSMRVEFLDAATAADARLKGAIANVSAGQGTVFDAAKLAREYGITTAADLKKLGKPQASGFWKDGIALSRLPEDVFQGAVNAADDQLKLFRVIGESGADEETMRAAYRYLVEQGPSAVPEGRLRQMLAMAGRSPAASSADDAQGDVLKGTEWSLQFNQGFTAKADLAEAIEQMLRKEKNLFRTVGRQAGQIKRVGTVDAGAAKEISGEAARALDLFDQMKFETGPIGDLLNENVPSVVAGQRPGDVARGMKNRLVAEIKKLMGEDVAPVTDVMQEDMFAAATRAADEPQGPVELTPDERMAMEAQALQEGISNGEVRPPNAPIPELPDPAQVRLDELALDEPLTPGSKLAQATADEVRLALEHKRADAAMAWDQEQMVRDTLDYHNLTFDEKMEIRNAVAGVPDVKIADVLQSTMRAMAESDARLYRGLGESLGNVKQGLNELADAPVRPEPLRLTAGAEQPEFALPQELSKSTPRWGRLTVKFESDLDLAAYTIARDKDQLLEGKKPSAGSPKFHAALEAAGFNIPEVVAHGKRVKAALKQAAKGNLTGQIDLPSQPFGDVAKPPARAGVDRVRQQIEVNNQTMNDIRRKAQQEGC